MLLARCEHRAMDALDVQFSFRLFLRVSGVHVSPCHCRVFRRGRHGFHFCLILSRGDRWVGRRAVAGGVHFDLAGQYFYGFLAGMIFHGNGSHLDTCTFHRARA